MNVFELINMRLTRRDRCFCVGDHVTSFLFVMLLVLLHIARSECYFAEEIFKLGKGNARYEAGLAICHSVASPQTVPQSMADFNTLISGSENFTEYAVFFYGTDKSTVSVNVDVLEQHAAPDNEEGVTVEFSASFEGSGTFEVQTAKTEAPASQNTLSLIVLPSVGDVRIKNTNAAQKGHLYVTRHKDTSQCTYTATDNVTPTIFVRELIMSSNIFQRFKSGQLHVQPSHHIFEVDDASMMTGTVDKWQKFFDGSGYSETKTDMGDGWTLVQNENEELLQLLFLVRKPTKVTMGPLSATFECGGRSLTVKTENQHCVLWIDVQAADAKVDFYAEDNIPPDELLGGYLTSGQLPLGETIEKPMTNLFYFHGENWPYTAALNQKKDWIRVDTVRDEVAKTVTRTKVFAVRWALFMYDAGENMDIVIEGKNLPLWLTDYALTITLASSDVGLQSPLHPDTTIKMCPESKCKLTIDEIEVDKPFAHLSGDGSLTVIAKVCKWRPTIPEKVTYICDSIDLQSGRDVSGLTLNENGVVKVAYGYPSEQNISDVTDLWNEKTAEH